jgi:CBS domain containing-hemolysin-like protein
VAAEFAIVGAPRIAVEQRAGRGSRLARLVNNVVQDAREQDRYIATAQLGITSASLGLGMYGEHMLAEWLAHQLEIVGVVGGSACTPSRAWLAIAFLTYLHVVLGEMVPKALALQAPVSTAIAVAAPMRVIELVFYPLVLALNGIGNALLALFGIERTVGGEEATRTTDEISFIVAESRAGGLLAHEPARVVQELLEFGELTAGEVMVPRTGMTALPLGADLETIHALVVNDRHTRYPVHDGDPDRILGVVHVKDLLERCRSGAPWTGRCSGRSPSSPPPTRWTGSCGHAPDQGTHGGGHGRARRDRRHRDPRGPVRGGGGGDRRRRRAGPGPAGRRRNAPGGRHRPTGRAGRSAGLVLEHEEVDTVSGLILATLGRPAVVGDQVEYDGVELEVTAVRGRGVQEVRVVRAQEPI